MRPLVVVTGGGRGIGAATCRLAAARGWAVAVGWAHDGAAAEGVVADIVAAGGEAAAFGFDVADDAAVARGFAAIDARFGAGRLRGLVNNAGVVAPAARVEAMDRERIARIFAVNVLGAFSCAREALARLPRGGSIVNVSSVASTLGSPNEYVDYAASKGAIDTFTVGLAREVAADGVRVNAVRPGLIETAIHASGGQPERLARLAPAVPMRRAGTADEVARSIVWLLGDDASYVTGALLDVGGGR